MWTFCLLLLLSHSSLLFHIQLPLRERRDTCPHFKYSPHHLISTDTLSLRFLQSERPSLIPIQKLKIKLSHYMPRRRLSSYSFSTRWGWVVSVTPRPRFSPGERTPGTHRTGGWVGPTAGLNTEATGKILSPLPGIEPWSPGGPARNQTLYWLSYSPYCPYRITQLLWYADGVRIWLWTAASNGPVVHPTGDYEHGEPTYIIYIISNKFKSPLTLWSRRRRERERESESIV
jgi:hypothetical protein